MATFQDSTGKTVEIPSDNTEAMKSLIESLKGTVKTKFDEKSEQLEKLIEATVKNDQKIKKAIESLPKQFEDGFKEVKDWIEDIKDSLKDIAKKREKGLGVNKKDLNPMEKAMLGLLKTQTEVNKHALTKGSIFTYDHQSNINFKTTNAILKAISGQLAGIADKIGAALGVHPKFDIERAVAPKKSEMSELLKERRRRSKTTDTAVEEVSEKLGGEATGALRGDKPRGARQAKGVLGAGVSLDPKETLEALNSSYKFFEGLNKSLNRTRRDIRYWKNDLSTIAIYGRNILVAYDQYKNKIAEGSVEQEKSFKIYDKSAQRIEKIASVMEQLTSKQRDTVRKSILGFQGEIDKIQRGNLDKPAKIEALKKAYTDLEGELKKINAEHTRWSLTINGIKKLMSTMSSLGLGMFGASYFIEALHGAKEDITFWHMEAGSLGALLEDSSKKGFETYQDLLDVSYDIINTTGQFAPIIRKNWVSAIKKGTRSLNETLNSMTIATSLSTAIGSDAEATADEFQKWSMHMGMGQSQISKLSRGIKVVAGSTGVMGNELLKAVSSARELAQEMKNAGFNIDNAAQGFAQLIASAQKTGVDKQMAEIIRATSGGLDSYMKASQGTKNLIGTARLTSGVISGTAMSDPNAQKTSLRALQKAIEDSFPAKALENLTLADGSNSRRIRSDRMSPEEISRLNFVMKRKFGEGFSVDEAIRIQEAMQEMTRTTKDKLKLIGDKLDKGNNLTTEEKKELERQRMVLEAQQKLEDSKKGLDLLSAINKFGERTAGASMADMSKEFARVGGQGTIEEQMRASLKEVNARLKDANMSQLDSQKIEQQISQAISENKVGDLRSVINELERNFEKASAQINLQSSLEGKKRNQQALFQNFVSKTMGGILSYVGRLPGIALTILAAVAVLKSLLSVFNFFGKQNEKSWKGLMHTLTSNNTVYVRDTVAHAEIRRLYGMLFKRGDILNKKRKGEVPTAIPAPKRKGHIPMAIPVAEEVGAAGRLTGMMSGLIGSLGTVLTVVGAITGGIGLAVGAIGAIFAMFVDMEDIVKVFEPVIKQIKPVIDEFKTSMRNLFIGFMQDKVVPLVQKMIPVMQKVFGVIIKLTGTFLKILAPIFDVFADILGEMATEAVKLIDDIMPDVEDMFKVVSEIFMELFKELTPLFKSLLPDIREVFQALSGALKDVFKELKPLIPIFVMQLPGAIIGLTLIFKVLLKQWMFTINLIKMFVGYIKMWKKVLDGVFNIIKGFITWDFDKIKQGFVDAFNGILDYVKDFAKSWWNLFIDSLKDIPGIGSQLQRLKIGEKANVQEATGGGGGGPLGFAAKLALGPLAFIPDILPPEQAVREQKRREPINLDDPRNYINGGAAPVKKRSDGSIISPMDIDYDFPKHHIGGIVSGRMGSSMPIMAHAGEAILTLGQQSKIYAALDMASHLFNALVQKSEKVQANTSMQDLDNRVQARVQESKPSGIMAGVNEELIKISVNTSKLVNLSEEQLEVLKSIYESNGEGTDEPMSGMNNTNRRTATNYYTWRQARYQDTAAKQMTNPGY